MKQNVLLAIVLVGIAVIAGMLWNLSASRVFGEVTVGDQTIATSTPQLTDRTNLCPQTNWNLASSSTGTLDSISINQYLTSDLLIMDATTTNSALRLPTATSSNILIWLPAGTGTTTIHLGVGFKRGLLVDYDGAASTTITYRCGS